jgi:hypothetical protein
LDAVLPELFIETLNNAQNVLTMTVKEHTGGVLLRIEYKLKFLDFGGKIRATFRTTTMLVSTDILPRVARHSIHGAMIGRMIPRLRIVNGKVSEVGV